ncbi:ATP phosphoribosyltransferase regulatory subunit [Nitratireductor basaltis]|uniref:ATP phosphoribosyltransferase regulatory subunit n=1 Tax=Nitratireductor basaltis TaxID=472175 RepID=A0A084UDB2_9HYPH|nr:ATP phosphoribosyltransferase regulatory subunit [Nitratireductor basaltis]KFB10948.1 ATP phosphoribosyltransferase regulatory subunit [Nitratireductor basaltis]
MTHRYPTFANDILALFAEREAQLADIGIIQPADPFLDMAGEDLRRRIFLTESETGETLCLRPEFTIPVCRDHIAARAKTPQRYAYLGEVFRQRRQGGAEFFQAGIEDLGSDNRPQADARSLADAHALLERLLPGRAPAVTMGDQALFEAVLSALGLPSGWQKRLARAFGAPGLLKATLDELTNPPNGGSLPAELAELVASGDHDALVAHIADQMEGAGLSPSAGRTPQEIAERLIEKAALERVRLSDDALAALRKFLALKVPLSEAIARLEAFAGEAGLVLDEALAGFSARQKEIEAAGLGSASITYDASFGRPLDYYTGFIFEITVEGESQPLVGGGRYDRLLTLLGAPFPIPGIGFSAWLDRIETLRERAS